MDQRGYSCETRVQRVQQASQRFPVGVSSWPKGGHLGVSSLRMTASFPSMTSKQAVSVFSQRVMTHPEATFRLQSCKQVLPLSNTVPKASQEWVRACVCILIHSFISLSRFAFLHLPCVPTPLPTLLSQCCSQGMSRASLEGSRWKAWT